eukprot:COSAG02_NODE_145_length_34010_cov_7.359696_5_plen_88_part_00
MENGNRDVESMTMTMNYDLLQVHVVIPLATCLRNGYAIPLGYAEFPVLKEMRVKKWAYQGSARRRSARCGPFRQGISPPPRTIAVEN